MGKILERLINYKVISLIKIAFISLTLLLSNIPLSSVAASNKTPDTGNIYYFDVDVPAQVLTGNTYYVATNGNDGWNGTFAYPWRTIQHAADTVSPGATVYVMGGTYNEKITITKSGSPGNTTTFASYPGQTATIDGTGIPLGTWGGLIRIFGSSYINIIGFNVVHSTFAGIMVTSNYSRGYPSNIFIQNNYVSDTSSSGIYTEDGNYITYDGNEVTHAQTLKGLPGQQNEIVDMVRTNNFEIKNNKIYDNNNFESIDIKEGSSYGSIHHNSIIPIMSAGIYIDSQGKNAQNIDVYNNRIYNGTSTQTRGIALATEKGGSLKNVRVYNNIVYNNAAIGLAIASYSTDPIDNVTFSSNTVYNNGLVDNWGGGIVIEDKTATNVIIVNNIAYQNKARGDLLTDNGGNSALFTNLVGTDPVFVNANNQDFHLKSSSPAIDKGSNPSSTLFVPAYDFDGNSRPQDAGYDIGAYEFVSTPVPFDFSLSLNPSNGLVMQGDSISTIATATLISGSSQPVSFSCSGLPSGVSCSFNPSSLYPPNSSTLTISASTATPAGTYSITINGMSGNITRTANYALKVNTANLSIGEAVDNTALQWTTGGNAAWFGQSNVYYYGNSAAQSGKIGDNQNTWVQTTVTGPGTLQFYWKVSSIPNSNILNFFIDNAKRARISGNTQWTQKTYTIPSGTHTLKWMYTKDKAATNGSDAGWLDKVVYTPSI